MKPRWSALKIPTDWRSLNFDNKNSLSEFARLIWELSKIEFDWITSNVDLPLPLSYSAVIPSFAIWAALTCNLTDSNMLAFDFMFDQAVVTLVSLILNALSLSEKIGASVYGIHAGYL